jgi:hypothetical protein
MRRGHELIRARPHRNAAHGADGGAVLAKEEPCGLPKDVHAASIFDPVRFRKGKVGGLKPFRGVAVTEKLSELRVDLDRLLVAAREGTKAQDFRGLGENHPQALAESHHAAYANSFHALHYMRGVFG